MTPFLVALAALSAASIASAQVQTKPELPVKRVIFEPASGKTSGELIVNGQSTKFTHGYVVATDEEPCPTAKSSTQAAHQAIIGSRAMNNQELTNPNWRRREVNTGKLSFVVVKFCANGDVFAVDVHQKGFRGANYVSTSSPFAAKVTALKNGGFQVDGKTFGAARFFDTEYSFNLKLEAKPTALQRDW
jgi:hypothetical protein